MGSRTSTTVSVLILTILGSTFSTACTTASRRMSGAASGPLFARTSTVDKTATKLARQNRTDRDKHGRTPVGGLNFQNRTQNSRVDIATSLLTMVAKVSGFRQVIATLRIKP